MNESRSRNRFFEAALAALVAMAAGPARADEPAYVNGVRVDGAALGEWTHDWDAATAAAKRDGKPVFVNFTGSDWCGWCKLLRRQVFATPEWGAWASNHVYLAHLDFPSDKGLVPEKYRERNREIARRYKVGGYPTCYLLDPATLDPIGRFGASRDATPSNFIEKVSAAMSGERPAAPKAEEPRRPDRPQPSPKAAAPAGSESTRRAVQGPVVTTNDFKAVLTGVAVVDDKRRYAYDEATFVPPETKMVVPYGKTALFRVEYDFPEGYGARVWTRDGRCDDGKFHAWYFGSNPSGMFKGKGTAYGFLSLLERGKTCRVRELLLRTGAAPELDRSPREWTMATVPVDIEFLEMPAGTDAEPATDAPAYVNGVRVDGAALGEWTHDWDAATAAAKRDGKPVFVNFTGSDWCGWCKLLRRQVFATPEWGAWASNHVYLAHLDFPSDKGLVPEKYRERNREIARRYKVGGYPTCYLLDPATLDPIGRFGASRDATPSNFIEKVSAAMSGERPAAPKAEEPRSPDRPQPAAPKAAARPAADGGGEGSAGLPISKFPVEGLVAGFTFNDADKADDFVKKGRKFQVGGVPPRWNSFRSADDLVTNGALRVSGEYKWEELPHLDVPELRYDRFTVAMNFHPKMEKEYGMPLVSFGGGWRWFHVFLRRDGTPSVAFRGLAKGDLSFPLPEAFRPGEWNWIVVAFDIAKHRLSVVLNGRRCPDIVLPADFAFQFDRDDREKSRTVQFANSNNGTVFKGEISGFLLFDRAFTGEELDAIAAPPAAPVSPWTFRPDEEGAALYWNGTISDGAVTLDARLAGEEASISFPERLSVPGGMLDLGKPFLGADGGEATLVGIGLEVDRRHVGFGGCWRDATEVRLPASLRYFGPGAFERFVSLERIDCPDSLRSIGSAAFDGCRSLRAFHVGPAVEFFSDDRVFMGCGALEAIEVDPANRFFKVVDGALLTADGKRLVAFPPGRRGPFAIPAGVEAVPARAFLGCSGLTRVSVPSSVKRIGDYAFSGCTALERIEFEDRSFKLDDRVFGSSRNGEEVHRPTTNLANE